MSPDKIDYSQLAKKAIRIRKRILDMCHKNGCGHIGSSFSIVEILIALYSKCMNISAELKNLSQRDRLILSKGHASPALYVILREQGLLPDQVLDSFSKNGGLLEQHPKRNSAHGIEVSTGSLGHGLSIGAGMALAAKMNNKGYRIYVILSDGECNEGSIWEATLFSSQQRLDNLIAIIDYNKIQALGNTCDIISLEPFDKKFESMGWSVCVVDGHNFEELIPALNQIPIDINKPSAIIAHTVKGKGVDFMENELLWHYRCPDKEEYDRAAYELKKLDSKT